MKKTHHRDVRGNRASSSYQQSNGNPRRSGGSFPRRHSNNNRRPQGGGRNHRGSSIHFSKFINAITEATEQEAYAPKHTFSDFPIATALKQNIARKNYILPSPIQDQSIPYILEGKDLVGLANTGTGKTAAFLIPMIEKLLNNPHQKMCIIAPTRELALQIEMEFKDFARGMRMYSVCCVGGAYIGKQIRDLKNNYRVLIGTPGRLKDLIERGHIKTNEFQNIVLDEADRMLDMGFIHDIKFILSGMSHDRQTLFFSATISKDIERLIGNFLNHPVTVSLRTRDTSESVAQDVIHIGNGKSKIDTLVELLQTPDVTKTLVFGKTKFGVDRLERDLAQRGILADSIHGDKRQSQRERALKKFKDNHINVLVATDVAARGIDVSDITHVINFDIPATYEDYIHRIGRTGRGGKLGKAFTFIER